MARGLLSGSLAAPLLPPPPRDSPQAAGAFCLRHAGARVVAPEVADDEVRRELLRVNARAGRRRLMAGQNDRPNRPPTTGYPRADRTRRTTAFNTLTRAHPLVFPSTRTHGADSIPVRSIISLAATS
jgi:hypothetical protein